MRIISHSNTKTLLNACSQLFMQLINNAFDADIRNTLSTSVALAQAAGVADNEILKSTEEIDVFFYELTYYSPARFVWYMINLIFFRVDIEFIF